MLPGDERKTVQITLAAVRKCFWPADIEALRSFDSHYRIQGDGEIVEHLGICIQQLARP